MTTFLKNNIKEEIPDDDDNNVDDQELDGTIVDYQFLVRPKQEQIDTKPNPVALELVGEIVDIPENHSKLNKSDEANIEPMYWELDEEGEYCEKIIRTIGRSKHTELFFCENCDFKTTYRRSYIRHINKLHQGSKPIKKKSLFFCKYCDFKTHNNESIKKHTNVHEISKENLPYGCTLCEFKSLDKAYIKRHMFNMHTKKDKEFICNICGHASTSLPNLRNHCYLHKAKREFECDMCSYKAISRHKLTVHKDYVHFKKRRVYKQVICDICGEQFTGLPKLNIHLLNIHEVDVEVKTYICYHCGKKSFKRHAFIQHVFRHSKYKEKMFCANCDYSTFIKTNLTQHMVKHNKHIKMHKCHLCLFETKRPHTLRNHIKTHLNKE